MWIARDKDNTLILYKNKPIRIPANIDNNIGRWCNHYDLDGTIDYSDTIELDSSLFPELKYEDEPKEVFLNTGYDMANQINHVWALVKCTEDELLKANQTIQYYRTKFDALEKIINDR